MESRFYEKFRAILAKKTKTRSFDRIQYAEKIESVKQSKGTLQKKKPEDYQLLKRYDIKNVKGREYLIHPSTQNLYVCNDEIFKIIHSTHLSLDHPGREGMNKELNRKYQNITVEQISVYLKMCETCQLKAKVPKKGLVVKPMVFDELNSRCQIDLIDLQTNSDGDYKFIFVYQDHLTKFIQLRPLKSKSAAEVAHALIDVFTILGAPCVLQSDNGTYSTFIIIITTSKIFIELVFIFQSFKIKLHSIF